MSFDFYMPTKIYFGENALSSSVCEFSGYKHALIVTGKHSARLCGALDDVTDILDKSNVNYTVFDKIGENPLLSVCYEGGQTAVDVGADLVIGIGGGSPLDAAKAIAAFGANCNLSKNSIFDAPIKTMLPLILIPTTAGTGSEANNYSVLTIDKDNVKKTFKNNKSYAKAAILNPKYTYTLSYDYTMSTALDAFCHCIESYLSPKSTDISSMLALYGAKKIWNAFKAIKNNSDALSDTSDPVVKAIRSDLMSAACAGGIAINTTGTGFPHPLGYSLTLYSGIPHGKACACFTGEYIKYNAKEELGNRKICTFAAYLETTPDEIAHVIPELAGISLSLSKEETQKYVDSVKSAANYANSPYVITYEEMLDIYKRLFI